MTDVTEAGSASQPATTAPAGTTAADAGPASPQGAALVSGPVRWLLASLLVGAGAIHVAMAPSHLDGSAVEGAGFLVAAWAQLGLAATVLVRPTRRALLAVAATSVALVGLWALSRTVGLPVGEHDGHAASVTLVDGVCVALEVAALVVAAGLLARVPAGLPRARGLAIVGAVGALALATAAIGSPDARDHAAGSHDDHGDDAGEAGDAAHDAAAHVDGDHAAAPSDGAGADHVAGHDDGGEVALADDAGFSALSNGHQHETGEDQPLTTEERVTLARQLASTAELVEKYPTIADAEAAGLRRQGPFSPGLGTHYSPPPFTMTPDTGVGSPMLVYDGLGPDAPLAGFMFMSYGGDTVPEGFAGPNDHWHHHENVCIVYGDDGTIDTPFGADLEGVTQQMCTDVGGSWIAFTGYMVHVWNVPGYESPDGMFTELNRRITCPDGSYDRVDIAELGDRDSVCP